MKNTIIKLKILIAIILVPNLGLAQNDTMFFDESIIIKAEFEPVVNEVYKILESPSIIDTNFPTPRLSYDIINKIYPANIELEALNAAKVRGEPLDMLYKGNIRAGIGTYLTPYLDLSYSETRNRTLLYSANLRHYSSLWSIKDYGKSHFANTDLNLYGKKLWDKFSVDARLYYENSNNYYYGFLKDSLDQEIDPKDYKTSWNRIGFKTTYSSLYRSPSSIHHLLSFSLDNLKGRYGNEELSTHLFAKASTVFRLFGSELQNVGLIFDYVHRFDKFSIDGYGEAPYFHSLPLPDSLSNNKYNTGIINVMPYLDFKIKKFSLHTSLAFNPEFGQKSFFGLFPTILVNFPIAKDILSFEGGVTGRYQRISLNTHRQENPYISPMQELHSTLSTRFYAKLNSNLMPSLFLSAEAGYENINNHHFYDFDPYAELGNMFKIVYDDADRVYAKVNLSYNYLKVLNLRGEFLYQTYSVDSLEFAYYKPNVITTVYLDYNISPSFMLTLYPSFKTKSKAMFAGEEVEISPIVDLNLSLNYKYNSQTNFFLRLNNLAFQRYYEYYNYPSQRFMAMIGLSVSF